MKKIPMRMCVVTKERYPKYELIRVVKNNLGEVTVDLSGKQNGKGAYIKKDLEVLKKAKASKVLNRVLETEISEEVYLELEKIIGE